MFNIINILAVQPVKLNIDWSIFVITFFSTLLIISGLSLLYINLWLRPRLKKVSELLIYVLHLNHLWIIDEKHVERLLAVSDLPNDDKQRYKFVNMMPSFTSMLYSFKQLKVRNYLDDESQEELISYNNIAIAEGKSDMW